jgi:predicted porin
MKIIKSETVFVLSALFATCASAQSPSAPVVTAAPVASPFTFYGVLDFNVRQVKTGSTSVTKGEADGNMGSRLGVRGEKAIDADLKVSFTLETPIKADAGTAGTATSFFSRRATVSLISAKYGELRMGREPSTTWWNIVAYDHFGTGLGSVTKLFVTPAINASDIFGRRLDNTVSYYLPDTLGGVYGQVQLATGEGAAAGGSSKGLRLGYTKGGLNTGVAYSSTELAAGGKFNQSHIGISYDLRTVKLIGQYVSTTNTTGGGVKENVWELGAVVPVSTAGTVKLGYAKASENAQATKVTLGYVHELTKDVVVYTTYTQIKNENNAAVYAVESAPVATAGLRQTSSGYEIGLRYSF